MKNSEYWEKRIANNTWKTYNSLEEKNRALLEMYQEASLNISDELYRVAEKMKTSTPMLSDMHKFNRLTKLQENMNTIIKELGENVETFGKKNMHKGFNTNYKNVMQSLGQVEFAMPNENLMEQLLNKPWFGSNFSTRLWKNTQVLATNLNDILTNGLIQGKTVTEMAIQLNNRMNEGFNVAHRLVRTETMHYLNESSIQAYKDSCCDKVQYWAASDERSCPRCGVKHGNPYIIKDAPVLPLHANCRCTYLPVIDEDDTLKDHDKAKEDINNEFNKREKAGYKYNKDGTIIITEDYKGEHYSPPRKSKPYAVIESNKVSKNGFVQIDRTLYNREGIMVKQIHSGHHNRPKQHPYGKYGEHAHIYKWDSKGENTYRDVKELTKKERREHKDILKE